MLATILGDIGVFVFAITGVLASVPRTRNVISLLMLAVITALGGGTIRDMILSVPVFWLTEFGFVLIALVGGASAFLLFRTYRRIYNLLLYLDGVGVAIFAIMAMEKSYGVNPNAGVAIIMGLITGIGGGLIRDLLTGRPTLLLSQELYATPILVGCVVYGLIRPLTPETSIAAIFSMGLILAIRAGAIHWNWGTPGWLNMRAPGVTSDGTTPPGEAPTP
jgi:uncharacterized membrane protein YeiH